MRNDMFRKFVYLLINKREEFSRKKHDVIFVVFFVFFCYNIHAQNVGISDSTIVPDPSALLELRSNDKGFLIPRMTTIQRDLISSPSEALMIFNTTTKCLEVFVLGWHEVWCNGACLPPDMPLPIIGDTVLCPGDTMIYSIAAVAGAADYTWTVPSGWSILTGQGTTSISVIAGTSGQNGNITVVANNICGSSPPQNLGVQVSNNGGVIGIRVTTGFYGYSAGSYSTVTITFNQPYTNVTYVSSCSGNCTCSGTGTTFHHATSGGTCLGTSLIVRDFEFAVMPTSAVVTMQGVGVHTYYPRFYWILSGGVIDTTTDIDTCDNPSPYIYSNWNETSNCIFLNPCQ
jgi:hypothetical protein